MQQKSFPRRVTRTTTRAAAGGMALLLAFIALMFLRNGGGSGEDGSEKKDDGKSGDAQAVVMASADHSDDDPRTPPDVPGGLSAEEKLALSDQVLTVLIDGNDYRIRIPRQPDPVFRESTLARVVTLAEAAPGDANGLRVRIERRATAMAQAEADLINGLAAHGIAADAVYMAHDLLP